MIFESKSDLTIVIFCVLSLLQNEENKRSDEDQKNEDYNDDPPRKAVLFDEKSTEISVLVSQLFADGFVRLVVKRIEVDFIREIVTKLTDNNFKILNGIFFSLRRIFPLQLVMAQQQHETARRSLR